MSDYANVHFLLVDDEALARRRLRDLLTEIAPDAQLEEAENGFIALAHLQQQRADIAIFDMQMPSMTGIELATHCAALPHPPLIIFATAHEHYALQAFEVNAVDYVLKPIRRERLHAALQKALRLLPKHLAAPILTSSTNDTLRVVERGRVEFIAFSDILYCKSDWKYISLVTQKKTILFEHSLAQLEAEYPQHFLRIHRNCLINRQRLERMERQMIAGEWQWMTKVRDCNDWLTMSRRQYHLLKETL